MIRILLILFIFCIVLFFYIHIQFHLKTSNDLEIFEIQETSKENLEEIFDLKQPVIMEFSSDINHINKNYLLNNYSMFDIKIRKNDDEMEWLNEISNKELYYTEKLRNAFDLFAKNSNYYSEKNNDFLNETGIIKLFQQNDLLLRPPLVSNCNYDIIIASDNTRTPFRYEINYRNFFNVIEGTVKVILSPPKNNRYLYPIYDYENFEFASKINPWFPQDKYKNEFEKIKCLEIVLKKGQLLYIPPYWWYSFNLTNNTIIHTYKYRTLMNNITIIPEISMYTLQNQNIERKLTNEKDKSNNNTNNTDNTDNTNNTNTDINDLDSSRV